MRSKRLEMTETIGSCCHIGAHLLFLLPGIITLAPSFIWVTAKPRNRSFKFHYIVILTLRRLWLQSLFVASRCKRATAVGNPSPLLFSWRRYNLSHWQINERSSTATAVVLFCLVSADGFVLCQQRAIIMNECGSFRPLWQVQIG